MMKNELILTTKTDGVVTLTLNRPEKHNALNGHVVKALLQALKTLSEEADVRVLIINGNGKNFCAGGDISWMQEMSNSSADENYQDAQMLADVMYHLYHFPNPTIALVHGAILGGGLGLVAACDIAIASKSTTFEFSEAKIGLIPAVISPYVIAAIGERMARYYFLTTNRFDVTQAHRVGLVHQITEDDALLSTGVMLGKQILRNGPYALKAAKQLLNQVTAEKITSKLAKKTAEMLSQLRVSPEAQEGLKAFVEKRDPPWRNK
jgi:methylglutaconyl-CoA hydratase